MAKRFQQLCASSRIMTPLCKHLSFDKGAVCAKKRKLAQEGSDLGPEDGLMCPHFLSIDEPEPEVEVEAKPERVEKKSRKRKKKSKVEYQPEPKEETDLD